MTKDCCNCINCDSIHGFICTCRYSYDEDRYHVQVGQDIHRKQANNCEHYTEKAYEKDMFFVI